MEKLRFKDENGDKYPNAVGKIFKDILSVQRGASPRPIEDIKWFNKKSSVGWVRISDISKSKKYLYNTLQNLSEEGIKKSRFVKKDSLILSICATIGIPIIIKKDCCIHDGLVVFQELNNIDKEYLYYFLENNITSMKKNARGTTQLNLNTEIILKTKINLPILIEQAKIANYFSNLDKVINNKQRQLELMEKYKKDLLDKIFNQKIRFKDENGCDYPEWNPYKITEILKTVSNKKHSRDFDILSVTKDNGIVKRSDNGINIKASEKSIFQYKIVEINDYILHLESFRNGIDKSYIKGVCSPVYTILREKTENILLPILFKYSGFIHRINQLSTGIRQGKNISFSSMENLKINLPIIEEQEKIANLFSNLDLKINVLKNSIKNLKEYKIDMLEKMF